MRGVALLVLLSAAPAGAFEIDSALSAPCHELLTLGALDVLDPPAGTDDDLPLDGLLADLVEAAERQGVPEDARTAAFVRDVATSYGFEEVSPAARWVLASFINGVRLPDTRGLPLTRLRDIRELHLIGSEQPRHTLRRPEDDGPEAERALLDAARAIVRAEVEAARKDVREGGGEDVATWSLSFYGDFDVHVFAPAWRLGRALHTVQDSYSHTFRDESGAVVSVHNFVDPVHHSDDYRTAVDGFPHSDRLDQCDLDDPSDAARFAAAREASVRVLDAAWRVLPRAEADFSELDVVLEEIYAYRPGCRLANDYCDNPSVEVAREGVSGPLKVWFCTSADLPPGGVVGVAVLLALGLLRRRRRHQRSGISRPIEN